MQNSSATSGTHGVLIKSIGSATLSSAAAVAKGLGINAADVIRCLYRAPAILVDKVEQKIAEKLTRLLNDIGYDAAVIEDSASLSLQNELLDIALYLKEPAKLVEAAQKLAAFVGMTEEDATKILLQPPGMALGSVSQATVTAFQNFMGDSVECIAAPQSQALYNLFLGECPPVVHRRLLDDLKASGISPLNTQGLIATDVERATIEPLWQRHKTNTALRVIQQDFLRFDVILETPTQQPLTNEQRLLLETHIGIPQDIADDVVSSAPVTLLESIPHKDVAPLIEALSQAQFNVSAELITFQALGLKILSCTQAGAVQAVLSAFGIDHAFKRAPAVLPNTYPEIQARIIRDALERAGAEVELLKTPE